MTDAPVIETERLRLRAPEERDFEGMTALMSDPVAAEHIGGVQTPPQIWRSLCMLIGHWAVRGYGFFAVEERATGAWVGRVGPWFPHGWPQPEVGWSILREHWGKGYATEAAAASMDFAFDSLGWDEAIHLIAAENAGSQGVARKLGSRDTGRDAEVAGFDMIVDVWGQTAAEWKENRRRLGL
ncbi:GNAT family N-acetyltransferase [Marinicauda salina]|uniref:GNAT family N-acetyltransferase n=1 Tax=Marinicauda salina TaxID=2135793 RepID=UPI001E631065|nr:GNAT family N-acetyltransferase [Marinicauda salina]